VSSSLRAFGVALAFVFFFFLSAFKSPRSI
jgi:hypothetical protein